MSYRLPPQPCCMTCRMWVDAENVLLGGFYGPGDVASVKGTCRKSANHDERVGNDHCGEHDVDPELLEAAKQHDAGTLVTASQRVEQWVELESIEGSE